MKSVEAVFQVTTPLFMSGSNQNSAEFRIPSFLGALRFWYRATAPGSMVQDITKLRKAEAELFGSSGSDTGQAAFLTRVDKGGISYSDPKEVKFMQRLGIGYLGYGLSTKDS
ncbi:MAG: type III-B CRISPR module RAMP protein Cmr1 [Syntrophaceticus schinkii]|nr:type III-B CRISPR module RAMP protein Cmr1 [Syntrophaceticus schinkii]